MWTEGVYGYVYVPLKEISFEANALGEFRVGLSDTVIHAQVVKHESITNKNLFFTHF